MNRLEQVKKFLDEAEVFYITTVDGDKPKARPISFSMIDGDKLWFGVGTFKEVYKQLEANQFTEIAAWDGEHFLRYYGEAVLEKNEDVVEKAFELMPEIAETYKANNWEMGVFYLDKATAEIRNMMAVEETYTFEY